MLRCRRLRSAEAFVLLLAAQIAGNCCAQRASKLAKPPQEPLTPTLLQTLNGHRKDISGVAFHGDNQIASCDLVGHVIVWDPNAAAPLSEKKIGDQARGIAFDQSGGVLVACSTTPWTEGFSGTLHVVDTHSGAEVVVNAGEPWAFSCLAIDPGGRLVACGAHTALRSWDLASPRAVKDPKHPRQPPKIKLQEILPTAPAFPDEIVSLAVCPKNLAVAVGCKNGSITLAQVNSDGITKLPTSIAGHDQAVTGLAFAPDGKMLVSTSYGAKTVVFWDPKTGQDLVSVSREVQPALSVCVAPHGALAATGHKDGMIRLWDMATGKQVSQINAGTSPIRALAFNSDGRRLASGGSDFLVKVWELYDEKPAKKKPKAGP